MQEEKKRVVKSSITLTDDNKKCGAVNYAWQNSETTLLSSSSCPEGDHTSMVRWFRPSDEEEEVTLVRE